MFFASRCYLCSCRILNSNNNSLVCHICQNFVLQKLFSSCARCGVSNCTGCQKMNDFETVESIFYYGAEFSKILVMAKDQHDYIFQKIFYELFYFHFKEFLLHKICKKNYDYIFFAPLRKERVLLSNWHSYQLFLKVCLDIKIESDIILPLYMKSVHKQALIPAVKRRFFIANATDNILFFDMKIKKHIDLKFCQPKNILLLDDVLTTGQTLTSFKVFLDPIYKEANYNILTLFRTPT